MSVKTLKEGGTQTLNGVGGIIKEPISYAKSVFNPLVVQNAKNIMGILTNPFSSDRKGFSGVVGGVFKDIGKTGVGLVTNTGEAALNGVNILKPIHGIYSHGLDTIGGLAEMSKTVFSWPLVLIDKLATNPIHSFNEKNVRV